MITHPWPKYIGKLVFQLGHRCVITYMDKRPCGIFWRCCRWRAVGFPLSISWIYYTLVLNHSFNNLSNENKIKKSRIWKKDMFKTKQISTQNNSSSSFLRTSRMIGQLYAQSRQVYCHRSNYVPRPGQPWIIWIHVTHEHGRTDDINRSKHKNV